MYNYLKKVHHLILFIIFFSACKTFSKKEAENIEKYWRPAGVCETLKCDFGKRKTIKLPDSTTVILGSGTSLIIPADFNKQSRELGLEGNALFEVVADTMKPFIIHTRHLVNTSSGGVYWIMASTASEGETVEVKAGILKAEKAYSSQFADPEILKAGEMVMINHTIDLMEKETFDTTEIVTWKSNILSFNNASISDVAKQLENWFGVTVSINDDFSKLPAISYTFTNATLQEVLETLNKNYHVKYSIEGENVTLKKYPA